MTLDIEHLRRLEREADPAPWTAAGNNWNPLGQYGSNPDQYKQQCKDAALIVAARNALPELLERLERLEHVVAFLLDPTRPNLSEEEVVALMHTDEEGK
jgi:hypothetical protein